MRRPIFVFSTRSRRRSKFDPNGEFIRHFVPELAGLANAYLFSPWEAPRQVLDAANVVLGQTYPHPIVDVKASRLDALAAFAALKDSMTVLRLILGDQLNHQIGSLRDINIETDIVLMAEVGAEVTYVKHHKRKIAFLFAAMRHFAEALRGDGTTVIYRRLDDPDNGGSLESEVKRVIAAHKISKLVVTMPGEYRLLEIMKSWQSSAWYYC